MAFNFSGGAFAEEMIVPEVNAFIIPANIDYSTAAALKSVYGTALHGLRDRVGEAQTASTSSHR
jgi:NADPH:quinone reductase-like Zn-dependent oxidoreductase